MATPKQEALHAGGRVEPRATQDLYGDPGEPMPEHTKGDLQDLHAGAVKDGRLHDAQHLHGVMEGRFGGGC